MILYIRAVRVVIANILNILYKYIILYYILHPKGCTLVNIINTFHMIFPLCNRPADLVTQCPLVKSNVIISNLI